MRYRLFFDNIQQDMKTFAFLLLVLCAYRVCFLLLMREYVGPEAGWSDIGLCLWAGFRLSLKSAGALALISFLLCTAPNVCFPSVSTRRLRLGLAFVYIALLAVLFQARIPYYREFHATFNQAMFHALNDDLYALLMTMVQQYGLLPRLFAAFCIAGAMQLCFRRFLARKNYAPPRLSTRADMVFRAGLILLIPAFMLYIRFGGSFNYNHSINWENAAVTKDFLLNEAILDDVQAIYRARSIHKKMSQGEASGIHKDRIFAYAKAVAGLGGGEKELDAYFLREAEGARLPKPRHIFIILGETYAQWPTLDKYKDLHIADGLRGLMREENADSIRAFLPNGTFTAMAVNAVVSGLSDVVLPVNYQLESYRAPYATAIAPQMQKLGYQVDFWYGGFPSWERIKEFSLAQGFDHFYGCTDYDAETDNIWGTKDEQIFEALSARLPGEKPTVHVILTVSNHPPYSLDLEEAGFDPSAVVDALPPEDKQNQELIRQLGHYWYMDKAIAAFVRKTYAAYPDSLFIITGDHADRTNISETPVAFERYSIPFVVYGQGVTRDLLPEGAAGGQVNILPTLVEWIAPRGFSYYSIAESLTRGSRIGFSAGHWITPRAIGRIDRPGDYELLPGAEADAAAVQEDERIAREKIAVMRTVSWYRMAKGNAL